eukprot:GHUV01039290.1.p2 GENE.GHUV01039290.1~~GHUV01039290.1.p2  ORF type:complete len:147 (+),score=23.01 GHUV01039290.1:707-1147(+)
MAASAALSPGDSEERHPCIGTARRMMVRRREDQADVLIEAVQNHTPDVIIVDEIGTKKVQLLGLRRAVLWCWYARRHATRVIALALRSVSPFTCRECRLSTSQISCCPRRQTGRCPLLAACGWLHISLHDIFTTCAKARQIITVLK